MFRKSSRAFALILFLCPFAYCSAQIPPSTASEATPAQTVEAKPSPIDSGDTAWLLTSSALVLMMTAPGLALFYSGLVRKKNVLGTMMQSFAMMLMISIQWFVLGYSLAFHEGFGCG